MSAIFSAYWPIAAVVVLAASIAVIVGLFIPGSSRSVEHDPY